MLVPAPGSAPLRGCFRKSLTNSSLRASSGYARKAKAALSGLLYVSTRNSNAHSVACGVTTQALHLAESRESKRRNAEVAFDDAKAKTIELTQILNSLTAYLPAIADVVAIEHRSETGEFVGMSTRAAIKIVLQRAGRALTSADVTQQLINGGVTLAELVDALDLGSSGAPLIRNRPVRVRIPCAAFNFSIEDSRQFLTFMVSESTAFFPVTPSRPARTPR